MKILALAELFVSILLVGEIARDPQHKSSALTTWLWVLTSLGLAVWVLLR